MCISCQRARCDTCDWCRVRKTDHSLCMYTSCWLGVVHSCYFVGPKTPLKVHVCNNSKCLACTQSDCLQCSGCRRTFLNPNLKPIPCQVRACVHGTRPENRGSYARILGRVATDPVYVVVPPRRRWRHGSTIKYNLFLNMATDNVADNPNNLLFRDTVRYLTQEQLDVLNAQQ